MMTLNKGDQECVLEAYETEIVIEAFISYGLYCFKTNEEGFYSIEFVPATMTDNQRLAEHIEMCKSLVRMRSGYWSDKDIRTDVELKDGSYIATQSFAPIVDPIPEYQVFDYMQQCSIKLYVNDDPSGRIYLNASYVDLYSPTNGIDEEPAEADTSDDDDFEW